MEIQQAMVYVLKCTRSFCHHDKCKNIDIKSLFFKLCLFIDKINNVNYAIVCKRTFIFGASIVVIYPLFLLGNENILYYVLSI